MTQQYTTWSVVATVDEPPEVISCFVGWYLSLGASQIFLYFDRPDDPAAAVFDALPAVEVVRCDNAHWAAFSKRRPDRHQVRQTRNATHAYLKMQTDWLLHVDADEFLWSVQPVSGNLSVVDAACDSLVLPVAERIFVQDATEQQVFAGPFRIPYSGSAAEGARVFGPDYRLTQGGMTGHAIGKAFTRRGKDVNISIHRPRATAKTEIVIQRTEKTRLLHFEGLTPLHWVFKMLRKADAIANHGGIPAATHRHKQIEAILDDPAAAMALHWRLRAADKAQLDNLQAQGVLFDPPFQAALCASVPGAADYGVGEFDRWLREEKGSLLERFGVLP